MCAPNPPISRSSAPSIPELKARSAKSVATPIAIPPTVIRSLDFLFLAFA